MRQSDFFNKSHCAMEKRAAEENRDSRVCSGSRSKGRDRKDELPTSTSTAKNKGRFSRAVTTIVHKMSFRKNRTRGVFSKSVSKLEERKEKKQDRRVEVFLSDNKLGENFASAETIVEFLSSDEDVSVISVAATATDTISESEHVDVCTALDVGHVQQKVLIENESIQQSVKLQTLDSESKNDVPELEENLEEQRSLVEDNFVKDVNDDQRLSPHDDQAPGEIEVTSGDPDAEELLLVGKVSSDEEKDAIASSSPHEEIFPGEELKEFSQHVKLLVLGNRRSGKSAFVKRYIHGCFSEHYEASSGVDFVMKELLWDDFYIPLLLCDVSGEDVGRPPKHLIFDMAKGAFLVHDAACMDSLAEAMEQCKEDIRAMHKSSPEVPMVLLINKCDESDVSSPLLDDLCDRYDFVTWYKISVKENLLIEDVVFSLVSKIVSYIPWLSGQNLN